MSSPARYTYNISKPIQNQENDQNVSYYTYNPNNNYLNQTRDIIYQNQNQEINQNNSFLNQTSPLPFNPRNPYYENNNININNNNDLRFSRLNSRLDEINTKISKEKVDKESFIHNKITNTELMLKTNKHLEGCDYFAKFASVWRPSCDSIIAPYHLFVCVIVIITLQKYKLFANMR